jgi:hypothetical protein
MKFGTGMALAGLALAVMAQQSGQEVRRIPPRFDEKGKAVCGERLQFSGVSLNVRALQRSLVRVKGLGEYSVVEVGIEIVEVRLKEGTFTEPQVVQVCQAVREMDGKGKEGEIDENEEEGRQPPSANPPSHAQGRPPEAFRRRYEMAKSDGERVQIMAEYLGFVGEK